MKVWYTLRYQFRNPLIILIHIATWIFFVFLFHIETGRGINYAFQSVLDEIAVLAVLGFITSYRETRGKLTGIAITQQNWVNWINNQEQHSSTNLNLDLHKLSENSRLSSFLSTVKNTVFEMFVILYYMSFILYVGILCLFWEHC